ncbi:MAG: C25 family cysteine peptidase, partial [Bacteroidota bacterium]
MIIDFSIDNPENYENNNKYPLMLSLGCYSGNMFAEFRSIGERFLLLENGGAGVYGASRGLGFIHALNSFGRYFYNIMSNDLYGATVGEGLRLSIENFEDLTDQAFGSLMEQFSLQGDPAFRLNPAPGVDLAIDPATATFNPTVVNVQRDSFDFSFDLYNLGKVEDGQVEYKIEQELPDGERRLLYIERTNIPHYQERITVTLPTLGRPSVGVNRIFVTVDANNEITELPNPAAESNNELLSANGTVGVPLFVVDNTAIPIWPADFGINGSAELTLKATSSDILASERNYLLQVDTTADFTQPLASTSIRQIGGLIEWQPEFNWQDST